MKKILLIHFSLYAFVFTCFSQPPDSLKYDLKLDSVVTQSYSWEKKTWISETKNEFLYTSKGDVTEGVSYFFDVENNNWTIDKKIVTEYNQNRNPVKNEKYVRDNVSNSLIGEYKTENNFDGNGNISQTLKSVWDSLTGSWIYDYKKEYQHDSWGEVQETGFDWYNSKKQWIKKDKELSNYNQEGLLMTFTDFNWNQLTHDWDMSYRIENKYDENSNLSLSYYSEWIPDSMKWMKTEKDTFMYKDKNLIENNTFKWNSDSNKWENEIKREFLYDSNDNQTQFLEYYWNDQANDWIGFAKNENSINEDNQIIERANYNWNDAVGQWVGEDKRNYNFDEGAMSKITEEQWDSQMNIWTNEVEMKYTLMPETDTLNIMYPAEYYSVKKIVNSQENRWDENSGIYEPYRRSFYYYSSVENISSADKIHNLTFKIFPNPADEFIRLVGDNNENVYRVQLVNSTGQLCYTGNLDKIQTIPAKQLNPGIYLVTISNNNRILVREKIIIQH